MQVRYTTYITDVCNVLTQGGATKAYFRPIYMDKLYTVVGTWTNEERNFIRMGTLPRNKIEFPDVNRSCVKYDEIR